MRGAAWMVLLGACYNPAPHAGAPCPDGYCPSGLVCSPATQTCETSAVPHDSQVPLIDASSIDARPDAVLVTGDASTCVGGAGLLQICPTVAPSAAITFSTSMTIDTSTSNQCIAYSGTSPGAFCVVAGTSISVAAGVTLTATGTRPLVLLASATTITIDGKIDVSSNRGGTSGAGFDPASCVAGTAATGNAGGHGGSFTGVGGDGGGGGAGDGAATTGSAATAATSLRGGCPGRAGGGASAGAGGHGGGAVYLLAASTLVVNGTIDASGAGGGGSSTGCGGGGGGAGGMIVLDAPTVTTALTSQVFANGGGGGEGATANKQGRAGTDATQPSTAASGGSGMAPNGGNGGAGSVLATRDGVAGGPGADCGPGTNQNVDGGGGGGGGAAGAIRVFPTQTLTGAVSPPPS